MSWEDTSHGACISPSVSRRKVGIVGVAILLSAVGGLTLGILVTPTLTPNDRCLWGPMLDHPQVDAQVTVINISLRGDADHWAFTYARAVIWASGSHVGELNPVAAGVPAGPMTYQDADGNGFVTRGDYFVVTTIPQTEYKLELYRGTCPYPDVETWTT